MREVLEKFKDRVSQYAINEYNLKFLEHLRTNMSSAYKCVYNEKQVILKIVAISSTEYISEYYSEYLQLRYEGMINAGETDVFPRIYEVNKIQIEDCEFGIIIEEFLPYTCFEGISRISTAQNGDTEKIVIVFLKQLMELYKRGFNENIIAHRDIHFDNLMYDNNMELRFIDSGSVKSSEIMTTHFMIPAPTRKFYSSPEYDEIGLENRKDSIIRSEIYTIGLIVLSLAGSIYYNKIESKPLTDCGIITWIKENRISGIEGSSRLSDFHKDKYINYILMNVFEGNDDKLLFRLLKKMTTRSVSLRPSSYNEVLSILERIKYD